MSETRRASRGGARSEGEQGRHGRACKQALFDSQSLAIGKAGSLNTPQRGKRSFPSPSSCSDEPLGSRRQPKMKYVYRLLRQGDIGEALTGKTVRSGSAAAAAVERLTGRLRGQPPLCCRNPCKAPHPAARTSNNVEGQWLGSFSQCCGLCLTGLSSFRACRVPHGQGRTSQEIKLQGIDWCISCSKG